MKCTRCEMWINQEASYIHACYDGLSLFVIEKYGDLTTTFTLYLQPDDYPAYYQRMLERFDERQDQARVFGLATESER